MKKEKEDELTYIVVPNNINEVVLAQLVAYSLFAEIIDSFQAGEDKKLTDEENEKLVYALTIIIDEHKDLVSTLSEEGKKRLIETVTRSYISLIQSINEIQPITIKSFSVPVMGYYELKDFKDRVGQFKSWSSRIKAQIKAGKKKTFYIEDKPEKEPADVWRKMLDEHLKSIAKNDEKVWKNWQLIPEILSAISWEKDQDRFIKDFNGSAVVDWDTIRKREVMLLHMPAKEALQAYTFFLTTPTNLSRIPILNQYFKKQAAQNSNQDQKEKNSTENTDTTATSGTLSAKVTKN